MHFLKKLYKSIKLRMMWCICRLFPINNKKVVISNYYGRGFGDNAKYIAEQLLNLNEKIKIVWVINNSEEAKTLPKGVISCKYGTLNNIYHLLTAKVWIDNCRKYFIMLKRKKQFYIQTWHGGGAQKKCELDAIDKLECKYEKMARRDAKNTDIMISESRFMTNLYHHSFWYNGPVYECGYPRYDILLKDNKELRTKVYKYFNIDETKELVLYAPTFRANMSFEAYNIDFKRVINALKKRFEKDYVFLIHLHPNVANIKNGIKYDDTNIINSTFYPDTQELLAVSSILIGDYSSINYDFSLKKLPVFRYVSDLEEYRNDRDLYFSFNEYPYPYAQNNDELETLILNFNNNEYLANLTNFFEKLGSIITSNATEKSVELVEDCLKAKSKRKFFEKNSKKFIY